MPLRRVFQVERGKPSAMEGAVYMNCILRKWRLSDAKDLAAALNNKKILNNLRDGLPFPYTEQDARDYITAILSSEENSTFAYLYKTIPAGKCNTKKTANRQKILMTDFLSWGILFAACGRRTSCFRKICPLADLHLPQPSEYRAHAPLTLYRGPASIT